MIRALRYLRIAFSVACLVACGLLVALSFRSHRTIDILAGRLTTGYNYEAISVRGVFKLSAIKSIFIAPASHRTMSNTSSDANTVENHVRHYSNDRGFGLYDHHAVMMPYWFAAVAIGMLAVVPWFSFHFGLRTFLVAITLIGLGLGGIVLLSRQ